MNLIIGIDPSLTGTAVATINSNAELLSVQTLTNSLDAVNRLYWIRKEISRIIDSLPPFPKYVFIENYGFACRGRQFSLGEIGGIIRECVCCKHELPCYEISPSSLKKFITGTGNAKKFLMLERVFRKYNVGSEVLRDDNQVDAYALARFGLTYISWKCSENTKLTVKELECMKMVGSPILFDNVEVTCQSKKKR